MFSDTPVAPAGLFGFINPAGLYDPSANGYSHVAVVRLPARVIHVAGQGGETADGGLSPRFEVQVAQALDNLALALASAGAGLADVAKLTVLVVDHDQERELKRQMGVRSQSTLIVFKGQEQKHRSGGVTDPQALKAALLSAQ